MKEDSEAQLTRDEVFAGITRSAEGMRGLQRYLDEIKILDDAAFGEATGGADRAEWMELLDRLNSLLGEVDKIRGQLHPDVN